MSDRVIEDNWNVAAGASPIGTVTCVDAWVEGFRADIPKNDVPTLILHGDADRILPPDAISRRQAKMIRGAEYVAVADVRVRAQRAVTIGVSAPGLPRRERRISASPP